MNKITAIKVIVSVVVVRVRFLYVLPNMVKKYFLRPFVLSKFVGQNVMNSKNEPTGVKGVASNAVFVGSFVIIFCMTIHTTSYDLLFGVRR